MAAVVRFWSQVFDTSEAYQVARLAGDPAACAHIYVAVFPDGTIASTIHYLVSRRCDATGLPRLVGEVDSVATRADAWRQGHAERLLVLVLAALEREGCDWSLLASTDMGRSLHCSRRRGRSSRPSISSNNRSLPYTLTFSVNETWETAIAEELLAFNRQQAPAVALEPHLLAQLRHKASVVSCTCPCSAELRPRGSSARPAASAGSGSPRVQSQAASASSPHPQ
jgi:hypothetical protein